VRTTGVTPVFGKWVSTDDHSPPTGVWVLGHWGQCDIEACMVHCRGEGKQEDDWWWETRSGDTAAPAFWCPINNLENL